jgi:DNA-binding LacI/PurR family transcriptional regulator
LYNIKDMNLEQVARRAKVSTATVSRVLNNASVVKTSTRARVIKAIEELKYHPNLHARNLAGGKSRTIGMIVSNMENPFFFDIYKTVENDAHLAGFEVVMANTDYRSEQLVSSIRLMIGRRVAGLAVVVSEMEPALIEELTDSSIPVVFYDVGSPRGFAAAEHHQHPGELPARNRQDHRLPLQPGAPKTRFCGTPCDAGADQRTSQTGVGRRGAL